MDPLRDETFNVDVSGPASAMKDPGTEGGTRACFYDSVQLPYTTDDDLYAAMDPELRDEWRATRANGAEFVTLLLSPTLSVVRYKAPAGASVPLHRHGRNQINFILSGALHYGNKVVGPGMGYFTPNRLYAWTAGPDGADFLEIFDGPPGPSDTSEP